MATLLEGVAFLAFFTAFLVSARIESPMSTWALVPHVLLNGALFLLVAKRVHEGRPPLYWSGYDFAVFLFFGWVVANIYYSEVRGTSWRAAGLTLDGLAAYVVGRMLFFRRVRLFAVSVVIAAAGAVVWAQAVRAGVPAEAVEADPYLSTLGNFQAALVVLALVWVVSLPFLWLRKPSNLMFLLYVAVILGVYTLCLLRQLGWVLEGAATTAVVEARHHRLLNLETAWRVVAAFPLAGCGIGTYPDLFHAYKPSPAAPFAASFNSLLRVLVELGAVGLVLLLFTWLRLPVYIMRRWALFPNRRLRMAVVVLLAVMVVSVVQAFIHPGMTLPGVWMLVWGGIGTLVSLVMVRDPLRIFDLPFDVRRGGGTGWTRTGGAVVVATAGAFLAAATVAVALPYYAERTARRAAGERPDAPVYGRRLEWSAAVFPLDPETWARLAVHYQRRSADPLQVLPLLRKIEDAYLRAIALNPYVPRNYSQLRDFYAESNEPAKALDVLKRGVRNNPNDLILRLMLVRELERAGSLALATYHVRQALERIAPEQVELYIRLAELYELRGLTDQAVRYYQYARQVVPDTPQTQGRMRRLRENLGLPD